MTHQDNVAAVRAACIAANPEITELKFGCIVSVRGFQRNAVVVGSDHSDNFCLGYTDNGQRCETWMSGSRLKDEEKILGRDATLPDVLLALDFKHRTKKTFHPLAIEEDGGLMEHRGYDWEEVRHPEGEYAVQTKWNLLLPLSGQSEETVSYLADLLKPND